MITEVTLVTAACTAGPPGPPGQPPVGRVGVVEPRWRCWPLYLWFTGAPGFVSSVEAFHSGGFGRRTT